MSVKDPRLSQILPVIRCSDCGYDVEFRQLGEHVCSSAPPMPALPVIPVSKHGSSSGMSSGAYKPGYKPPPIPINGSQPASQGTNGYSNNAAAAPNGTPISPGRPSTASGRPALPFLEKYAKKNKSATSASSSPPATNGANNNNSNNNLSGSPLSVSPTTPTAPSYDRQVLSNGTNGHYQREQNDYFPKTPMDDRFPGQQQQQQPSRSRTPQDERYQQQQQQQQQPSRSRTPMEDNRYGSSSPVPGRSKTPVTDPAGQYSSNPNSARQSQQPAVPQKSNARSPSIASAQGLGIQGLDANGRIKSPTGGADPRNDYGRDPREREREREWERNRQQNDNSGTSPPSASNGFHRTASSGSAASSVADRASQRERSNTVLSERSERSVRSARSERSGNEERSDKDRSRYPEDGRGDRDRERDRGDNDRNRDRERERERDRDGRGMNPSSSRSGRQDPSSAYKTPSPPISPEEMRSADSLSEPKPSSYRPPTPPDVSSPTPTRGRAPPTRKASGDQFDALMDDLIKDLDVMPASTRDSARPASSHRSRSRPNLPDAGMGRNRDLAGSPPPTPGLPMVGSGSDSVRSHRSGRGDREREQRSERSERDRGDREQRSDRDRERDRGDRAERDRSDRDRERGQGRSEKSDRDRERERGDRERERGGGEDRARDRERTASARSSTRSRSTNRRGTVQHCEGCKHDIQPEEAGAAIKMSHGDYHPECFKCARCRRPIESPRHGHEYEGRLLCEKDYQRYLEKDSQRSERPSRSRTTICAGCEAPIQGETPVYALGQSWHEHHLSCYHCQKPIQQSLGHVEKNGRVYCSKDFGDLFLPKCRSCGLPVEKEAVCAQDGKLQGKWHAACFGCQTCKKPFPDKSFYVYGDAPYCRRHYHKLNNSLCKSCDQPIEGPCAQTMEGWRFHPGCFSCVQCKVALTDIYYNFENQAYCEKDIMVIQRTRNVRAERRKTFFGKV
ncbi:hypothetical protein BGZ58_009103 [Dissophora ornata]|nr:hypothetical protein BGZ58_009103 [Dissophora ornata]